MVQKYDGLKVKSPGTVIISASGHCNDIRKIVKPVLNKNSGDLYYVNLSFDEYKLGGSSFAQTLNKVGSDSPEIKDPVKFKESFNLVQNLIYKNNILSGHDISSGGLITCLLEMCFSSNDIGLDINLSNLGCSDSSKLLFSENSGIIIQSNKDLEKEFSSIDVKCSRIGNTNNKGVLNIKNFENSFSFNINKYRDIWYSTSKDFDLKQTKNNKAIERFNNYKNQPLEYIFPNGFNGNDISNNSDKKIKAAIIREKGSNSEREMAYMISLAGFDVKDIHMTDFYNY